MSYILDALKKSEQERELVRMLRTAGASHHFWMPARRRIWPVIIGLALLTGITLTVLRFWSPADSSHAAHADRNAPAVPTAAIETSKASAGAVPGRQTAAAAEHPKIATADLAAQLRFASSAPEPVAAAKPQASDVVVAKTAPPSAGPVTQAPVDPATVPFLREMPNEFRHKLPELVVNVHLYSANEAENLVYINNQQLRRGEQLEGGIRLEEIVPEGVVLSYAGTFFKLPRPN